jgi:hypothetical protein
MSEALEALLNEALRQPKGHDRETWLAEACRGDASLEHDLRELLAAHDAAGAFLSTPLVRPPPGLTSPDDN